MKRFTLFLSVLILAVLSTGTALADGGPARVRVMHTSPDAPNVNVLLNGNIICSNVTYGQVTIYSTLEAGTYNIKIITADPDQNILIDENIELEGDQDYTVATVGQLAAIELLKMADTTETPELGRAKVRVVHTSPNAPAVDVAIKGGETSFSNVPFKAVTEFTVVDSATYDIEIRESGTDNILLELPWVKMPSTSVVTILVMGLTDGEPRLSYKVMVSARYHSGRPPHSWRPPCCGPGYFPPPPPPSYYCHPQNYANPYCGNSYRYNYGPTYQYFNRW